MRLPILAGSLLALLVVACGGETRGSGDAGDTDAPGAVDAGSDLPADAPDGAGADTNDAADVRELGPPDAVPDAEEEPPPRAPDPGAVVYACAPLPEPAVDRCDTTPGSGRGLLLRGTVLGSAGIFDGGGVLIVGDRIACVGCGCEDAAAGVGATVVTCPEAVISPGLINAHDHITFTQNAPYTPTDERYGHRHDWRRGTRDHTVIPAEGRASDAEVAWGELRQVIAGTTSLAGSGEVRGFLRNLDKADAAEVGQGAVTYQTFPLADNDGELLDDGCAYPSIDPVSVLNADCYLAHVSEGIDAEARNEFLCLESEARGGRDLAEANSAFVHMIALTAEDAGRYARQGGAVVWSPRSNITLYGHTAPVTLYANLGIPVALGTDWTATGSIHVGRELACAAALNAEHFGGFFSPRDLWRMVTIDAASALHVDDALGALRAGYIADVAVFDGGGVDDPHEAIVHAEPGATILVLRGGAPLFGDTSILTTWGHGESCETMPAGVCGVDASVCLGAYGGSFASLEADNTGSYGLYFCGVPEGEPPCVPFRAGEFDGVSSGTDGDGDGIDDALDNCPRVFNAPRPIDGAVQPDTDGDGRGDACDYCPLNAGTCARPDPNDRDADGVVNLVDNCPGSPNGDQADMDGDLAGDVCDACPETPNPGGAACAVSIVAIKTGAIAVGARVQIEGVVTAAGASRLFVQVPTADRGADGPRHSAIMVYHGGAASDVVPGDLVRVVGSVSLFFDQLQLASIEAVDVTSGGAVPDPEVVGVDDVATGGPDADAYEGVLVRVEGTVTDIAPPLGTGDTAPNNQFVLGTALRVDDRLHLAAPFPEVGEVLSVTGPVWLANGSMQVTPRTAEDVRFVRARAPRMTGFGPSPTYVDGTPGTRGTYPEALTVTLDRPAPDEGVTVAVSAAPEGFVVVPDVVVSAGAWSAPVEVEVIGSTEDPITLTAAWGESERTAMLVTVAPGRVPAPVSADPAELRLGTRGSAAVTIALDIPAGATGTVLAVAPSTGAVAVPEELTVAPFATTATLRIDAREVGVAEVTVTGGTGSVTVLVSVEEIAVTGLRLSEVFYNPAGADDGLEWVEIFNGTAAPVDLSGYTLGYGGASYQASSAVLSGVIPPGGCAVVGGPSSTAANHLPAYLHAVNFSPDIQNSGEAADAVGLFEGAASAGEAPVDAVIYGGTNSAGFAGADGLTSPVSVSNAPSGQSIEAISTGWRVQTAPSPGACAIATM